MAAEAVKVIVRCRPMNGREKDLKCKPVVFMDSKRGLCQIKNPSESKAEPKTFTFDGAYYLDSTTEQIYNDIGYPLVEGVTEGYNGTIFAYGQTGCGKSYTMQGVTDPATQRGVIPRAFDHIFETISVADQTKFLVHASYCEIYNEEIRDLLGKDAKAKLDLKEHPDKGVYVQGLSMHPVHNVAECERVMEKGWKNRATGSTLMNSESSRSHSIFSIHMEMITKDEESEEHIRAGKLNLVDLAGSERQAKTGATGDRLKEATKINLSLSALGNVISALVDGRSKHIPYRDSKLTRLLQDSLGGNTKTLMVACLSPADNNYDETLSTLRYANRAKNIKNKPKINEDPKDALLREYQEEIQRLKAMLTGQLPVTDSVMAPPVKKQTHTESLESIDSTREELEREKERIRQEYDYKLEDIQAMYEKEKINKNKLQEDMSKLRVFYDDRLATVEGQLSDLPTTAEDRGKVLSDLSQGTISEGSLSEEFDTGGRGVIPHRLAEEFDTGGRGVIPHRLEEEFDAGGRGVIPHRLEEEIGGAPRLTPGSLDSLQRPQGPGILDEGLAVEVTSVTSTDYHDEESGSSGRSVPIGLTPPQRAIHLSTSKGDPNKGHLNLAGVGRENLPPEHMELLKSNNPQLLAQMHKEAVDRLHELQMQMVGGENADNAEIKQRREEKKKHSEGRAEELMVALDNDDESIMMRIYTTIQQEVFDKTGELEDSSKVVTGLKEEIKDLQAEFELDRTDYLDTIRKQEKQIKLYMSLVEKIHPCVRRECNYINLDKMKNEAKWDEENEKWLLPKLTMERNAPLPNAGVMPGGRLDSKSRTYTAEPPPMNNISPSEDRLRKKLEQVTVNGSVAETYFQSKRANQLLNQAPSEPNHLTARKAKQLSYSNGPQQDRHNVMNGAGGMYQNGSGGGNRNSSPAGYHNSIYNDDLSKEQRAAFVHGKITNNPEEPMMRRPQRLESLNPQTTKKSKKKRNALEPI